MAWTYVLDGEDISTVAADKNAVRTHNGLGEAQCKMKMSDLADITGFATGESRLKVYDDSNVLWHHGIVWDVDDDADENSMYTVIQSKDAMALWPRRLARDADGDYSYPSFLTTQETGPQIMQYILENSAVYEGQMFLALDGTVETGGFDLSGVPVDYPVTIWDVFQALIVTGQLDVVLKPVEGGPQIAQFNAYNGDHGDDLSGSVVFQYAVGANNVRRLRRSQSMTEMTNKLIYLLGPKKATLTDPDAAQHWRANVTGSHPGLANPPGGDIDDLDPLGTLIFQSRARYWPSMDVQTFDTALDSGTDDPALQTTLIPLWLRRWQAEQIARVGPKTIAKITPIRGTEPTFDVGDLVTVQAGASFRGGFVGVQRVYKITVNIDNNGVVDLGEIQTSGDQEMA